MITRCITISHQVYRGPPGRGDLFESNFRPKVLESFSFANLCEPRHSKFRCFTSVILWFQTRQKSMCWKRSCYSFSLSTLEMLDSNYYVICIAHRYMYMYVLSICKSIYLNIYNYTSSRSLIPLTTFISSPYFHMHPLHHPLIIPNWPASASLFLAWFRIRFVKGPPVTVNKEPEKTGHSFTRWIVFWKTIFAKTSLMTKLLGIWHHSTNICKIVVVLSENTLKNKIESWKHTKATYKRNTSCGNARFASILPNIALRTRVFSCNLLQSRHWNKLVILDPGLFGISSQ